MFRSKSTGVIFDNRKQAITLMGQVRYKKFLKEEDFEWNYTPPSPVEIGGEENE